MSISSAIDAAVITQVAELLGREPRGLEAVEVVDAKGQPSVIRVASLVDDKPFPTMFWLVDKALSYQIDQLEAGGLIANLQAEIDASEDLKAAMIADHQQFIQMRDANMTKEIKVRLVEKNYYEALQKRGIGGIANFVRIRCLHTYYASHLVRANTIGTWLDREYL